MYARDLYYHRFPGSALKATYHYHPRCCTLEKQGASSPSSSQQLHPSAESSPMANGRKGRARLLLTCLAAKT